jgi:bifunctional DNase/RNase
MENKVKLKIVGISYSQIRSGAYALILAEENGQYHIPIVIGASEAQSIAIKMEKINMPRPLTHDLITNISQAFGIKLTEIFIYKFEDGIFYSELTFNDGDRQIVIDARTSDAVALAIRTKAPIFTTREIIDETGFIMEVTGENSYSLEKDTKHDNEIKLENLAIEELERMLNKHIDLEEYEQAAHISKIIKQKKEAI